MAPAWLLAVLLAAPAAPAASAQGLLLTLLEGDAVVLDGARRVAGVAGLRLAPGTIVETAPNAALARIEWPERGGVVDLGPGTKAMLAPPGFPARSGKLPAIYLLRGWAKIAGPGKEPFGSVLAPGLELLPFGGAAVLQVDGSERLAFAEAGTVEAVERGSGKRQGIAQGALYTVGAGVQARPPGAWLARVPRAFRDPLPLRAAAFKERSVAASALPDPTYVQLADWLTAEPALRADFPRRFGALAKTPEFRRAVQTHMSAHPEWNPILNPPTKEREGATR
jgi:hypothetical protein